MSQCQIERKTKLDVKTIIPTIHFSIGVTRHAWNIISGDGDWSTIKRGKNWSIDLIDSEFSSESLLRNLLIELMS